MLLTIISDNLYAQLQGQARIDSLLKELPKQKEDTNKVNLLKDLSAGYSTISPDEGLEYGHQGLDLSRKLNWQKGIAASSNYIGVNYQNKSDYPNALANCKKALIIFEEIGFKKGIASATGNIGNIYQSQSDYPKALEYHSKALKIFEEIGDKTRIAVATGNIALIYFLQSDYPKALAYDFKALKMFEENGNKAGVARLNDYIGYIYSKQNDYPKALEYCQKGLTVYGEIQDKQGIARSTTSVGVVYEGKGDYSNAMKYYFEALKLFEEIGEKNGVANIIGNIAGIYADEKNFVMAIKYAHIALNINREIGNKSNLAWDLRCIGNAYFSLATDSVNKNNISAMIELPVSKNLSTRQAIQDEIIPANKTGRLRKAIDYLERSLVLNKEINAPDIMRGSYKTLAKAYKLIGDYKKAMECSDNYHAIEDSVFTRENKENLVKMEMKNEYEREHLTDSLKTAEKEKIATINLQKQKSYTYMGIAGILLLAGFSFFIVKERRKSETARKQSDDLLLNILPEEVAAELKTTGTTTAKHYDNVTVLFTDFVNFTHAGEKMSPQGLIDELHACFKAFDEITGKYNIEKIKTIGDAYLAVAGLPTADPKHAENTVRAAIELNGFMQDRLAKLGSSTFEIRIGIHSGSVVAGIVGVKKFAYDIWGDTVNTAARMEQNSEAGKINISQTTYQLVKDKISCEYRGEIDAKGKGQLKMYYVG